MVRVLLCHHFKNEKVFSESYQPTSLCSTREYLFIGIGGCKVFVYSLQQPNFPLVCQFSTISTSVKLICNDNYNYLATIERRQQRDAIKFSRVYFNWEKASLNEAVRVVVAGHSFLQRDTEYTSQFLAVELSSRDAVSAIATCKTTGNIVIFTDGKLCLYRQVEIQAKPEVDLSASHSSTGNKKICDFEHFLDIEPGCVVRGIDLCENFVAFRSNLEVRVVKLEFHTKTLTTSTGRDYAEFFTDARQHNERIQLPHTENTNEVIDDDCVYWSFDPASASNQASKNWTSNEHFFKTIRSESTYRDTFCDGKEILGPATELKGHPIRVVLAGRYGIGISIPRDNFEVQAVTMMYRRFRAESLCNNEAGNTSLHSLQLLPTYVRDQEEQPNTCASPLSYVNNSLTLCGMCILVSGPKEGYIYDIYKFPRLISVYKYTRDTFKVSAGHTLLHAVTKEGLETYTVRMFAAACESIRQEAAQRLHSKKMESFPKPDDSKSIQSCTHSLEGETAEGNKDEMETGLSAEDGSLKDASHSGSFERKHKDCSDSKSQDSSSNASLVAHSGLGPLELEPGEQFSGVDSGEYLGNSQETVKLRIFGTNGFQDTRRAIQPNLPIHDLHCLNKICPPSTFDICLIGMYPFDGAVYVMCSEDNVVLYTKTQHAALQTSYRAKERIIRGAIKSTNPEWYIYQLQIMDPVQLYKAVSPLASRCQKNNPQAFHHLVCEQYLFITSYGLHSNESEKEKKKFHKLLCESSANLGDLYARAEGDQCTFSAEYYDLSGLPLRDIVSRAWKLGAYGDGLTYYLDQKLLGSDEPVVVSESIAKKIFKIYSRVNPSRVSEVILMSSLTGFSPETSIAALEDLKKTETKAEKIAYRFSALDNLVSAILYLNQCEPDHAQAALSSMQESEMIDTVIANSFLLHDDYKHLTPLAQMLRKHKPNIFLLILLGLHDSKTWSLETILNLLGANKSAVQYNYQVSEFLEAVLNDKKRTDSFPGAVDCLSKILLHRLMSSSKPGRVTASHQHIPMGDGHFASRQEWLNQIEPFSGSYPVSNPSCPIFGKTSSQSSPRIPRHLARPSGRTVAFHPSQISGPKPSPGGYREEGRGCCCCCCMEDLLKLQSLLSSPFSSPDLCTSILSTLSSKDTPCLLSVRLLCLPRVGSFKEALSLVLQRCPETMIAYGELVFKCNSDMWSQLLDVLLKMYPHQTNDSEEETRPRRKVLLGVLNGTLSKLAQLTSPLEFLSLIPDEGSLSFFLPFFEQSARRCGADKLCSKLFTSETIENSLHIY